MTNDHRIAQALDAIVPRGGTKPRCVHISLEDYLSRVANLHRKLQGAKYRRERWDALARKHVNKFRRLSKSVKTQIPTQPRDSMSSEFTLGDIRLENEFEVLLYSVSSSLSALTRVVASFLPGSAEQHSHSRLERVLQETAGFERLFALVSKANSSWVNDLKDRRDAASHYVALSLKSTIVRSSSGSNAKQTITQIAIPESPQRFVSVWEDSLPTIGGTSHVTTSIKNAKSLVVTHELFDGVGTIVLRRDVPLQPRSKLVDGGRYVERTYDTFEDYILAVLLVLEKRFRCNGSKQITTQRSHAG